MPTSLFVSITEFWYENSDIENSRLETGSRNSRWNAEIGLRIFCGDNSVRPNRRTLLRNLGRPETPEKGDTGWLPQKDSNSQMSNSNPVSDAKTRKSGRKIRKRAPSCRLYPQADIGTLRPNVRNVPATDGKFVRQSSLAPHCGPRKQTVGSQKLDHIAVK